MPVEEQAIPTPGEQTEVVTEAVVDFESYQARRNAELSADPFETEPDSETEEPEHAASETVTEEKPAEETPEPTTEKGAVDKQEVKPKEDKGGIPQSRLDEVTKARRDAERDRDAAVAKAKELETKLAQLSDKSEQAKPDDQKTPQPEGVTKPEPAAEKKVDLLPEPVMPDPPTLDEFSGDVEEWQSAHKKFLKEQIPKFQREMYRYERQQETLASEEKARTEAETKKSQEAAQTKEAAEAEANAEVTSWNDQVKTASEKYPEFIAKVGAVKSNPAIMAEIADLDNGAEVAWWLANHPEEYAKIMDATDSLYEHRDNEVHLKPGSTQRQVRAARRVAARMLSEITIEPEAGKPVEVKPAAEAPVTEKPEEKKAPPNPKPQVSRAPKPPSIVTESHTAPSTAREAAEAGDFEEYERKRIRATAGR